MKKPLPTTGFLFIALLLSGCYYNPTHSYEPQPKKPERRIFVVLGSSTAEGTGAGTYDSSWVGRCSTYLRQMQALKQDTIVNLGRGGLTSTDIMATGDANRNVTKALSYRPYGVIINMPTNDIAIGRSVDDQMANFATIAATLKQKNVELWVTTSQPRDLSQDQRNKLIDLRNRIIAVYGDHAIDFWSQIANADGTINPYYGVGDGIHLNHIAHKVLFRKVLDKKIFNR